MALTLLYFYQLYLAWFLERMCMCISGAEGLGEATGS
jgi:hypothetical protein